MKAFEISQVKHIKSGKFYTVLGVVINATNSNDGQKMILYTGEDLFGTTRIFVREQKEFLEKFISVSYNNSKD